MLPGEAVSSEDDGEEEKESLLKKAGFPDIEKDVAPSSLAPKVSVALQKRLNKLFDHEKYLETMANKKPMHEKFLGITCEQTLTHRCGSYTSSPKNTIILLSFCCKPFRFKSEAAGKTQGDDQGGELGWWTNQHQV